jgi:hypothetical protein
MGKRDRFKSKKLLHIHKTKIMERILPAPKTLLDSKEKHLIHLKEIYNKHLKEFISLVESRKSGQPAKPFKLTLIGDRSSQTAEHYHDPANEFLHIFDAQFNRFISQILVILHEVYESSAHHLGSCIKDSFVILQRACKDVEKVYSRPAYSENNYEVDSAQFFQERILKDCVIARFLAETEKAEQKTKAENEGLKEQEKSEARTIKKKENRRNKKETADFSGLDKEIEEFQSRLEQEQVSASKFRPNFSDEWIKGLRKRLKFRS